MTISERKIKEVLSVLYCLLYCTNSKKVLKHKEYIKIIKECFDLDIDKRRVSQILQDIKKIIEDDNYDFFPYFTIKKSTINDNKIYRDSFVLSDEELDLIKKALLSFADIDYKNAQEIINKIENLKTQKSIGLKSNLTQDVNINLKIIKEIYDSNDCCKINIDYTKLTEMNYEAYPIIYPKEFCNRNIEHVNIVFYTRDKICLSFVLGTMNFVLVLPIGSIRMIEKENLDKESLEFYKMDSKFDFDPKNYKTVDNWGLKHRKYQTQSPVNIELKIYGIEKERILDLLNNFLGYNVNYTYILDDEKKNKEIKYIHIEELNINFNIFFKWYLSNVIILSNVEIVSPRFVKYYAIEKVKSTFKKALTMKGDL